MRLDLPRAKMVGKYAKPAGIQAQDQFIDQRSPPRCVPAFKDNDGRNRQFMDFPVQFPQLDAQTVHLLFVFIFGKLLSEIDLIKHRQSPSFHRWRIFFRFRRFHYVPVPVSW